MKAIAYDKYGPLDSLEPRDIPNPVPKDGEVLVRVHAAGLAVGDVFAVRGAPYAMHRVSKKTATVKTRQRRRQ